jgi:hypothetical protein
VTADEAKAMRQLVDAGVSPPDAALAIARLKDGVAGVLVERAERILGDDLVDRLRGLQKAAEQS